MLHRSENFVATRNLATVSCKRGTTATSAVKSVSRWAGTGSACALFLSKAKMASKTRWKWDDERTTVFLLALRTFQKPQNVAKVWKPYLQFGFSQVFYQHVVSLHLNTIRIHMVIGTKSRSHLDVKLAPVQVFSCKQPLRRKVINVNHFFFRNAINHYPLDKYR